MFEHQMKTKITLVAVVFLMLCGYIHAQDLNIQFKIVSEGQLMVRDAKDKTYSAVVYDQEGFSQLTNGYPITLTLPADFFTSNILIVGFSDKSWAVTVDGFKHKSHAQSPQLYLDLHDKGVEVRVARPPDGMKHTAWCAIQTPRGLTISHVQVREGAIGLCQQYGKKEEARTGKSTVP